jgi:hypothetical protein
MSVALETHSQVHLTRATQWGVHPLNPAPLAATAPPVAPRTADLVASSRRVA